MIQEGSRPMCKLQEGSRPYIDDYSNKDNYKYRKWLGQR